MGNPWKSYEVQSVSAQLCFWLFGLLQHKWFLSCFSARFLSCFRTQWRLVTMRFSFWILLVFAWLADKDGSRSLPSRLTSGYQSLSKPESIPPGVCVLIGAVLVRFTLTHLQWIKSPCVVIKVALLSCCDPVQPSYLQQLYKNDVSIWHISFGPLGPTVVVSALPWLWEVRQSTLLNLPKSKALSFFLGRFPGWRQCVGFTRCIMLLSSLQGRRAFVMSWLLPRSIWIARGVNLQGPNWKHLKVKVIDQQSRQARSRCLSDRATSRKWTAFVSGFCKQRLAVLL